MFADPNLPSHVNTQTAAAAQSFHTDMSDASKEFQARGFDGQGLSQGMPFVWKALGLEAMPFFFSVG